MTSTSSITSLKQRRCKGACTPSRGLAGGFSLIELMIAIVLGLLVLAGLINLFVANNKAFQIQSGNSYLQENLRIASDRISWSARMADFWGGNEAANVAGGGTSDGKTCNLAWATAIMSSTSGGGAIFGYDGSSTLNSSSLPLTCIGGTANYVPGSDVLVVRYAYPQMLSPGPPIVNVTPAESTTISGNPKETFLLATSDGTAQLFPGNAVPVPNGSTFPRYAYPYQMDMYYLRPCSVMANAKTCATSDDGGTPLPTLMRAHLQSDGTIVTSEVVDGIEQLKFEYGVTADPTNVMPVWSTAAGVGSQWANVVAVRVSLVAVSPTRDVSVPHAKAIVLGTLNACSYNIINQAAADATGCPNFTPYGDKPWQFVRVSQQFIAQLRNRVRSAQ